ncbi:hypothetical protein EI555_012226, partial [Monodon monoceros]
AGEGRAVVNVSARVGAGIVVQLGCRLWLWLVTGLGHCAWEALHVMSRLRLWLPRLFLTWLQLWLQFQAIQPPAWALGPIQVTSNRPRLTEAWSSYTSDPPPKLPHALIPLVEAGGFNYLTSSSPVQMLAPPHQELTETAVPYPDTDSVAELPTGPHQFAVPHQGLNNKKTQHQKIPEAVPVLDWNQSQPLVLPSRHKSSKRSKPMKFIVSPPNLKKDLVQHQWLAKVVGTTGQFENNTQGLEQQLLGDYLDPSMDAFYPEESLPRDFLEAPEELETSSPQEALAQLLETRKQVVVRLVAHHGVNEAQQSNLYNVTVKPLDLALTITPQVTKEVEPSPVQQHTPSQPPEYAEEVEPSPTQQETTGQPPEPLVEAEPSPSEKEQPTQRSEPTEPPATQQETPAQLSESFGEAEASATQEETSAQSNQLSLQSLLQGRWNLRQLNRNSQLKLQSIMKRQFHLQHSNLSSVAVKPADVELTITKEPTPEVGPFPNQHKPSAQPSGPLTNAEFSTTQHEAPTLPSEPPEEVEPLPVQQEAPAQSPEAGTHNKPSVQEETPAEYPEHPGEEFTPATSQQETPDQHPQAPEVVPSPPQQEATAQPPEPPGEVESSPTQSPELSNDQAQLLQRPDVTVKPVGLALIVIPAFTNEVETSPPQQETSAQSTLSSEQLEPLSVRQEFSDQHPTPSENVEHFPVHQGAPIQPPYPEVTFPNPEQVQAHHPTLIEVTIQPLDLGLTRRPEPTKEDEPSPVMQETLTQPAEPPKEVFVAQPPVYHNPIVPTPDQDHTEPPTSPSITLIRILLRK